MDRKLGLRYLIILLLFLVGCENTTQWVERTPEVTYDMRLPMDENGYYHLTLDRTKVQTIHRVDAYVGDMYGPIEAHRVEWESNLYWFIGDTLGYVVKRDLTDDLVYVSYDTTYITWFNGYEVPTTNEVSYSNIFGDMSNMIAPTKQMVGDTLRLSTDDKSFNIVLD
tara:strand:- start:118 stop:618 length:501 start_codon:yes stop_codon:yes gene_type:complete